MRRSISVLMALRLLFTLILSGAVYTVPGNAVLAQSGADVVMVLPFENTRDGNEPNRPEYNWVGESFADSLAELLTKPGLRVVSSAERDLAYQRLRLPETVIPSRATAIKLAREAKASMLVIGTYSVKVAESNATEGNSDKSNSSSGVLVQGTVRVIKVNEG